MFGRHGLVRPPPMATMNVQLDMNQPRTPVTDSRALQNLIKAEKTYVDELLTMSSASLTAASSLHAWGMSETPDLDAATAIHQQIHHVCFIARSVNFPVSYQPEFIIFNAE